MNTKQTSIVGRRPSLILRAAVTSLVLAAAVVLALEGRAQTQSSSKNKIMKAKSQIEIPEKDAIRPFHVSFPEAELTELRRRIDATMWPERETVTDTSQG